MAAEGLPVQTGCRVVGVSDAGYYVWRKRMPSARSVRHAWLTDMIRQIHTASTGVYGSRRVHAELRLGRGVVVGHGAVELLNRRRWKTRIELANAIFEYLEIFHNRQRRHSALGMLTPNEYEKLRPTQLVA
jgi:transposase InsO family protein